VRKVQLPKLDEKEIIIFETKDQRRLEKTISESNDPRNYGVLVCLYMGLRIGELCGLKWDSISLTTRTTTASSGSRYGFATPPLGVQVFRPYRARIKPPLEVVVMTENYSATFSSVIFNRY